jgi:hypothetical protein
MAESADKEFIDPNRRSTRWVRNWSAVSFSPQESHLMRSSAMIIENFREYLDELIRDG